MLNSSDDDVPDEDEERVYYAISADDSAHLKFLMEDGVNPNIQFVGSNNLHKSALHLSCEKGHYDCAQVLITAGANLEAKDDWLQTPLMYSVCTERENMVQLLLQHGCNVNNTDRFGKRAIHYAVSNVETNCLKELLRAEADTDLKDDVGRSPLWMAVSEDGRQNAIRCLIDAKCDVNLIDVREKRTPLQAAILNAKKDSLEYVELLLQAGAATNTTDQFGHTPMMTLIRRGRRRDGTVVQPEDLKIGQLLLDSGLDVNHCSLGKQWFQFKGTALKMAADRGATQFVEMLLNSGANPNTPDDKNVTPLLLAAMNDYRAIGKLLIERNCCLETEGELKLLGDMHTVSPFKCAVITSNFQFAKLLIRGGLPIGQRELNFVLGNGTNSQRATSASGVEDLNMFFQYLISVHSAPRPLQELVRFKLRTMFSTDAIWKVDMLPLPRWTRDFILYRNLSQICDE